MDMDMNSGLGHTQDLDGSSDAIIDALAHLNPDHGSSSAGHDNVHGLDSSFHLNQDTLQHHQHQDLQGVIDSVRESQNGQQSLQNTSNATGQRQDDDVDTMDTESLRTEVRRLRGIITSLSQPSHGFIDPSLQLPSEVVQPQTDANDSSVAKEGRPARSQKRKRAPRVLDESAAVAGADEDLHRTLDNRDSEKRARKTKSEPVRDEETGKRVEKSRKTELSKIVRATIRARLGINENDPLPAPVVDLVDLSAPFIPDWTTPLSEANTTWVEGIVSEVYDKAGKGLYTSLPLEDINEEVIGTTTRTAFSNMCRKYIVETDPNRAAKKEGYVKGRRRWARKDLKQKRRLKALSDPSFGNALPPAALHLDYMSSEYSSPGEDSDEEDTAGKAKRAEKWGEMMTVQAAHALNRASNSEEKGKGKGGWADGVQEKVLEVRTPRWRSNELNAMYRRLDAIAAMSSSARNSVTNQSMSMGIMSGNVKAGHVAPSHQRFVMPPPYGRRGKKPRDPGEGWMWQTGQVEVWPEVQEGDAPGEQEQPSNQLPEESQWTHEDTGALVDAIQGIPG